jgi:hypothetical protein
VEIIHGPLESKEAAEFAQRVVVLSFGSTAAHAFPDEHWNVQGRLLRFLRDHEGKTPEDLAVELAERTPWAAYERKQPRGQRFSFDDRADG